jgi:sortase A
VAVFYWFFSAFISPLWYQSRQRSMSRPALQSQLAPRPGNPDGVLQVETPFTLNVAITQGDGPADLRSGPGHRPGTPLPGALGNSVIYGRAKLWGGPFGPLRQAQVGTQMYLRTRDGTILAYQVVGVHRVPESEVARYLGNSKDYRLTLVTDAGGRFSDQRLVVIAVSGTAGQLSPVRGHVSPGPSAPSLFSATLLECIAWLAGAALVVALLRRRHTTAVVVAAATPLVIAALVAGFLELDLLWSPLA